MPIVTIEKLVHGGQGLGVLPDGKKVFVWNALPGEQVEVRLYKQKRDYAEGVVTDIVKRSKERAEPRDENYLSTSPWQIMDLDYENQQKQAITTELFAREQVSLPAFELYSDQRAYGYRNKMEYSFFGDDEGLHLALHKRGSHHKEIVTGSSLAMDAVNTAATSLVNVLPVGTRAGELKTVVVRSDQQGNTAAALYVKDEQFTKLSLPDSLQGLKVYFSNPRSPASVPTKLLYTIGSTKLSDKILGTSFTYQVDSFFQGNVPVYEQALQDLKDQVTSDNIIDIYAGVGSIGLSLSAKKLTMIEIEPQNIALAKTNAHNIQPNATIIAAAAESAIDHIQGSAAVIVDPPRAGLHTKLVETLMHVLPSQIIYLSCNPATQARDFAKLATNYELTFFKGYNFFPHTPHIESLAVLQKSV